MKPLEVAFPLATIVAALLRAPVPLVVALGAAAILLAAVAAGRSALPLRHRALAAAARAPVPPPPSPPRRLVQAQQLVVSRGSTAGGVHHWLRPLLRDIAAERLVHRHGVDLDDERAAALVPEPLWDIVRPGRPAPQDRNRPGLDIQTLTAAVEQAAAL